MTLLRHLEKASSKDFGISNAAKKALTSDKRPSETFCVVFLKNYPKFTRKHLIWSPFLSFKFCDFFWINYFNKYLETVSLLPLLPLEHMEKGNLNAFPFYFTFIFLFFVYFLFFFYSDIFFFVILC